MSSNYSENVKKSKHPQIPSMRPQLLWWYQNQIDTTKKENYRSIFLTYIDVKILNVSKMNVFLKWMLAKMLAKWMQQYVKRSIHHNQLGFVPGMPGWFNISKSISVIHHINKKKKNTIDAERIFPGGSDSKESAWNAGDLGSIPGSGRAPGEGNGNPFQYSCLENPMDGGDWPNYSPWVTKSWMTSLSLFTLFQHPFMIKTLNNAGIDRKHLK